MPPPVGGGRRKEVADKAFYWRTVVGDLFGIILYKQPKTLQQPLGVNFFTKIDIGSLLMCFTRTYLLNWTIHNQNIESYLRIY